MSSNGSITESIMSFLTRTINVSRTAAVVTPVSRIAAVRTSRTFTTSLAAQRTATEAVKDELKHIDRAVSDKLVDGINIATKASHKVMETAEDLSSSGVSSQVEGMGAHAKGKAEGMKSAAKGKAEEMKGKAEEMKGKAKGTAAKAKGKADETLDEVQSLEAIIIIVLQVIASFAFDTLINWKYFIARLNQKVGSVICGTWYSIHITCPLPLPFPRRLLHKETKQKQETNEQVGIKSEGIINAHRQSRTTFNSPLRPTCW
ncbi:hypothetical protein N5P37_002305 [Trichoderma harzianum]|nr:hypothetical protein N5P37_002305 [Trichoderma harzianum]